MRFRLFVIVVFAAAGAQIQIPVAGARISASPVELYQQGSAILSSYRGHPVVLHQAKTVFSRLVQYYPAEPYGYLGMSQVKLIEAYRSDNHYNISLLREALPLAKKALELGPLLRASHENYNRYVEIFELNYYHQEQAREYISLMPDSPQTYLKVADFIRDQGDFATAVEYYQTALDLKPSDYLRLRILKRMGLTYLEDLRQPQKAIACYQEAVKIKPDSPVVHEYLGVGYLRAKDYASAVKSLRTSLSLLPSSTTEFHLLIAEGYLAQEQGRLEEAAQLLDRALRENPLDSAVHFTLGNIYFERSQFAQAHDHFRQVIELSPKEYHAYFLAGRSADSLGKAELANDYYRQYLQLNSAGADAAWVRQHVVNNNEK